MFFVQTNHTRKELLFLMFKEINLRNHSSLHKLFYSLLFSDYLDQNYKELLTYKDFRSRFTKNSNNNGWASIKCYPLPYIVRNEIDHPDVYLEDDTGTNDFKEEDLKESIQELFKIYDKEFTK